MTAMIETMMAVMAEIAAVVMTTTVVTIETVAAVYQRGRWLVSSVSEIRIMWNIKTTS
jgi:hypothetical protein